MKSKLFYLVKYVGWIYNLYFFLGNLALKFLKLFVRQDDKLILFICFGGKKFDDSPMVIYNKMITDRRFDDYRIVWAFSEPEKFSIPRGEKVKCDTFAYFKMALKARVWITNSTVERGLSFKSKYTFYYNSWHGTPIKRMGSDIASDNKSFRGKGKWNVDVFTCQGKYDAEIFGRSFAHGDMKSMKIIGLPRNDKLAHYSEATKKALKEKIGLPNEKKVILYAPTFREFDQTQSREIQLTVPMDLKKWRAELGDKYVLLFRAHYEVAKHMEIKDDDFVREMSGYPQLEDLMIVSDILVSDYSSMFFDYSVMHKPMLSFSYDYNIYAEKRGMYFDIRQELPWSENEDGIISMIKDSDISELCESSRRFQQKYVSEYGEATEKSLDLIFAALQQRIHSN